MLDAIQWLCRQVKGSHCARPRLSSWALVEPSALNLGIDLGEVGTLGTSAPVPINVKLYAGSFTSGLAFGAAVGGMSASIRGFGIGAGLSAGLNTPFLATNLVGKMPPGLKHEIAQRLGSSGQNNLFDGLAGSTWDGISRGTRLVTGPDCTAGELTLGDFSNVYATIFGLTGNFGPNGVSSGLIIFARKQPVIEIHQLPYATAFGLMYGTGVATSVDLESTGLIYKVSPGG